MSWYIIIVITILDQDFLLDRTFYEEYIIVDFNTLIIKYKFRNFVALLRRKGNS